MADKENTEVPPASEALAPVTTAAPVTVVRERSSWVTPLVAALVVVAALVLGGVSGFALAAATHAGGRPAIEQSQQGPQQGPQQGGPMQGPGGPQGERPDRPTDDSDESTDDDATEDESTEG
ncbi:hypothetical protein [Pseudolysinimonas yzui]|uniref:Uncharacterized protein n=1 Tax=Pseudolysinimonas yzui TaxID=2708254 RepID=A0A8J3GTD9_9MICO|nr:hypothetical protein [Pseudolysinimonas yzui]GHF27621.1 hypothetical protein GCM10011600_30520 [Pseudolysinimonas yzui]